MSACAKLIRKKEPAQLNATKGKAKATKSSRRKLTASVAKQKSVNVSSVDQLDTPSNPPSEGAFKLITSRIGGGLFVFYRNKWLRLCGPVKALGYVVNPDGSNPELLVQIRNLLGDGVKIKLSLEEIEDSRSTVRALSAKGLPVDFTPADDRARAVHYYLRHDIPDKVFVRTSGDGWIQTKDSLAFVHGPKVYGKNVQYRVENLPANAPAVQGDIDEWLHTTKLLENDSLAVVMMGAALASVLLYPLKRSPSIVVLLGKSSTGKSTILKFLSAFVGLPAPMATWEATANGFEAALASRQDQPFVIDEIGQGTPKLFASIAYRATNGASKLRATDLLPNLVRD